MARFTIIAAMLLAAPASLAAVAAATVPTADAPVRAVEPVAPPAPGAAPAVLTGAAALKAGEYHWPVNGVSDAPVTIAVSIADQKLYAWRGGALFAVSTVSTGRKGHATPTGAFPIMEKHREHYSNKYDNAPMPFMQRLTNDGVALHAGRIPGYPASHGCVRLPRDFAERLFAVTRRGGMVVVTDQPLAALVAHGVTFDARTGQPLPAPAPVLAPIEPTRAAPTSLIAAVVRAAVPSWRDWSID